MYSHSHLNSSILLEELWGLACYEASIKHELHESLSITMDECDPILQLLQELLRLINLLKVSALNTCT